MKIRAKLFFVFLSLSALLVLVMYGFSRWKFEDGFLRYVQQAEMSRLTGVVDALSAEYAQNGSWQHLLSDEAVWFDLVMKNVSFRRPPAPAFVHHDHNHGRPPMIPNEFMTRLLLADADFTPLINQPGQENVTWEPISVGDKLVGYLGLFPRRELKEHLDKVFLEQQNQVFAWVAAGAFLFSLVTAQLLARGLSKPLSDVAAGTKVLAGGDYRFRLPVTSRDELGQLCADFNCLAISLEKNQNERQTWLATFSHELRTPIAILHGEIEAMQEGIRPLSSDALQSLREETDRISRLVDDLYELSRSAVGTLSYRKASVDLVELIDHLINPLKKGGQGLTFELSLPEDAWVWGDESRLTQLIRNLLQNSQRYGRTDGRVNVSLSRKAGNWSLVWEDDGVGVPDNLLTRIFEPFFQSPDQSHTSGAGLGLAICKNIVEAHQGTITASRSHLGGLAIKVELPYYEGDA